MNPRFISTIRRAGHPKLVWQTPSFDVYWWIHESVGQVKIVPYDKNGYGGTYEEYCVGSLGRADLLGEMDEDLFNKLINLTREQIKDFPDPKYS